MPSRPLCLAILLFWLSTMTWLVLREVAPSWRAGEAPVIVFDLKDEAGGTFTEWTVLDDAERPIGEGSSSITRLPDRSYELDSKFRLTDFSLFHVVKLKRIASTYRVTHDGRLLELQAAVKADVVVPVSLPDNELIVRGQVTQGLLDLKIFLNGVEFKELPLQAIRVDDQGVLNPMHLVNRVGGLYEGRSWRIPLLDLSAAISGAFAKAVAQFSGPRPRELLALVHLDELTWNKEAVPCFRIDYAPPGDKVTARTWVRRRDGLVLRQEAELLTGRIALQRLPRR